ncbi:MAG: FAD-binding oxidoreductase, partial [Chloroflexota bacterium]|nr:FAD-binding oxidoreductase [Chloroflexota bacterium]
MKKIRRGFPLRTGLMALLLAIGLFFTGRKVNELSADPVGAKDCPPLVPAAGDPAKTYNVKLEAASVGLPWAQQGGVINDASCLNRTAVYGIVQVTSEATIGNALRYAAENGLKISIAGVRHSMGGHAFSPNAVVLDMTKFNAMTLNEAAQTLTVQSGATWHDIQSFLHPKYAVKAMQSTDIFTVGGSISVNAHGMDHQTGAIGRTVRSLRLMLADGSVQTVSRTQNPELFHLVIGGYGLFGIILEVELEITDNAIYTTGRQIVDYQAFPELFNSELVNDKALGLFYGHLSTAPQSFLQEMILYTYRETAVADAEIAPLGEVASTKLRRFVINFSKQGAWPMRLKWFAEKHIEPRMEACTVVNRNQAMTDGEACLVSRNEPMHDSVKYLQNNLPNETDILHEYFIPRAQFVPFVDGLRQIMTDNQTNLLNASVRVVHQEDNFLNYAPTDMF